jgi:MFS family permease
VPFSVGSFIASIASARLAARLGRTILVAGTALLVAGMGGVLLTVHLAGTGLTSFQIIPAFFVSGLGLGCVIAPLANVILSGVDPRDAGSASGVLTTLQQVGGAVGVAVIGVIFFGLLGSHSTSVARAYSPGLQRALIRQHVPAPVAGNIARQFERCFHDRSSEKDPTVVPPSCKFNGPSNPAVARILLQTRVAARERNFSDSFDWSLLFNIGLWSATLLLLFALPHRSQAFGEGVPGGH